MNTIKEELARLYKQTLRNIATAISSNTIALCSDGWSSRGWKSYLCVGACWIDSSMKLQTALLDFRPIPASHPAEVLESIFSDISADMKAVLGESEPKPVLNYKNAAHTTDGAPNFMTAVQDLGSTWIHCYAHLFNLVQKKAILSKDTGVEDEIVLAEGDLELGMMPVEFDALVQDVRKFVSTVRSSSVLTEFVRNCDRTFQLEQQQQLENEVVPVTGRSFKSDVETRFSSTLLMLERFLQLQHAVFQLQAESKFHRMLPFFKPGDFMAIEEIVSIMKPFSKAITLLSSSSSITYTLGLYLTRFLRQKLQTNKPSTTVAQQIQKRLLKAMDHYIPKKHPKAPYGCNLSDFQLLRLVLDPRFKSLEEFIMEEPAVKQRAMKLLRAELRHVTDEEVHEIQSALDPSSSLEPPRKKMKLEEEEHKSFLQEFSRAKNELFIDEVDLYMKEPQIDIDQDPLKWWRTQNKFPRLRALARRSLAVFATSIFCEEVNSMAGYIVNPRRASLSSKTVKYLVFLNRNRQFLPEDKQ